MYRINSLMMPIDTNKGETFENKVAASSRIPKPERCALYCPSTERWLNYQEPKRSSFLLHLSHVPRSFKPTRLKNLKLCQLYRISREVRHYVFGFILCNLQLVYPGKSYSILFSRKPWTLPHPTTSNHIPIPNNWKDSRFFVSIKSPFTNSMWVLLEFVTNVPR